MKTTKPPVAMLLLATAPALFADDPPTPREVHQKMFNVVKHVRDVLVPAPVIHFVETFPPIAVPRQKILQLAQVEPGTLPAAPPPPKVRFEAPTPPTPPVGMAAEAAVMADWASGIAMAASENAMRGLFPSRSRKALVVSTAAHDAKSAAQIDEDLNVMMRILEKSANTREEGKAMGIDVFAFTGSSTPRVFYLDGYGALFVLKVKHPLMAPQRSDADGEKGATTSSEWERARQEVYGRPSGDNRSAPSEEFDAERVEKLKSQLIEDLSNGTHIRNLKSDDSVTVVVIGGGARTTVRHEARTVRPGGAVSSGGYGGSIYMADSRQGEANQTTMTVRAKKPDIDAFAKGQLTAEEFRKKVSVQVY